MRKVTLVFPKSSWKFERTPYPPLGIGYLAAVLQQYQWEVSIIDGQILKPEEYQVQLRNIKDDEIVGISTTIKQVEETKRIARLIKKRVPKTTVIVGGPGVSVLPEKIEEIDIIVKGEAENTLPKLLENLSQKKSLDRIDNFPKVIICENPTNLDDLPYPARDLFPLGKISGNMEKKYRNDLYKYDQLKRMPVWMHLLRQNSFRSKFQSSFSKECSR